MRLFKKAHKLNLQTRLMFVFAAVVLIQAIITGVFTHRYIQYIMEERIGEQALQLSKVVSIRVGGDNQRALQKAESYISKAVGSLGPSLRGKSPIFDNNDEVIGVTSVGYMLDSVDQTVLGYQKSALLVVLMSLIISILISVVVTRYFKRVLFGYEPEEIASLYEERNTTLETIREGVIAIDAKGRITTFNRTALKTLGLVDEDLNGKSIRDIFPESPLWKVLNTGEKELDKETQINGQALIVNRLPIKVESHDYANKLHTIAGLIQINAYDQALELIGQESRGIQDLVHLLVKAIPDPILSGCILGKYNRANELGLELILDPSSHLAKKTSTMINSEELMTILGNIIDNAFEATRLKLAQHPEESNQVILTVSDYGNDIIFEIEDHGFGISEADRHRIFQKGISSKTEDGHGYGLFLVKSIVNQHNGQIDLEQTEHGGARFIIYLPKKY